MEYIARLNMNKEYFTESYAVFLSHVGKFRKWEIHAGTLISILALFLLFHRPSIAAVGMLIFGLFHFIDYYFVRYKWIQDRIKTRSGNSSSIVEIIVSERGVYQKGPTSEGTINWAGVKSVVPTKIGLILRVGDGMSIYIPDSAMDDKEFKNYVVSKCASKT